MLTVESLFQVAVTNGASNNGIFCALNGAVTLINDALNALPNCTS